eukprot:6066320-Pyramimonas_sp.AAC.1
MHHMEICLVPKTRNTQPKNSATISSDQTLRMCTPNGLTAICSTGPHPSQRTWDMLNDEYLLLRNEKFGRA